LRCRIWHLEHNLRDITSCCSTERERRMSLEVLIGGKIFIFIRFPRLSSDLTFNNYSFLQMFLIDTTT
jgi:hypothetical protein